MFFDLGINTALLNTATSPPNSLFRSKTQGRAECQTVVARKSQKPLGDFIRQRGAMFLTLS
jgi:hypothetical protein